MTVVVTKSMGVQSAKEIMDAISDASMNVNFYVGFGRSYTWNVDASPDTAYDSTSDRVNFWRNLIGGKKVTGSDVSLVAPRVNWSTGVRFAAYTDSSNTIYDDNFYVLSNVSNEFQIYKCIDNNGGETSTVQPTYTITTTTKRETDGYVWKYMGKLSTAEKSKFLNSSWIPVHRLTGDDGSDQWNVQYNSVDGSLEAIVVTTSGTGYNNTSNVLITISGDGSSATAIANINTTSQTVSNITITNPGMGYHFSNAVLSGGGGSECVITPVISPLGGHGKEIVEELGASYMMINIQLTNTENAKFSTQNDFRQIALMKNPRAYGSSNVFSKSVFTQAFKITLSAGSGDYTLDEYVYQGGSLSRATFSGIVHSWDTTNNAIMLTTTYGTPTSEYLIGVASGTSRFVVSTTNPDLAAYSGQVCYINNTTKIQRATNQTENLQLVFSF